MKSYCIDHPIIITMNPQRTIIEQGYIGIREGKIAYIGETPCPEEAFKDAIHIDATGSIAFPGLINTHNHLFQTLTKGVGDDRALDSWLSDMTFPAAAHLDPEDVYYAALHGCAEGIKSGTTTMFDYMYPHPREGLDDAVIQAFIDTGIRGVLARGMMDCGEQFGTPTAIMQDVSSVERECQRLFEQYHNKEHNRISIWVAPAAIWSNSKSMLRMVWELTNSYKSGLSVHISETPFDRNAAFQLHGASDAEVLQQMKIVGPNVLMVHCVYLTERDMRMATYYDMKVSHNPISNMYLSSGVAPIPALLERGVCVGLGTDGPASNNSQDMIELLKFTALLQKVHAKDPTILTAEKVFEMATIEGAKSIGMDQEIGSLEVGKRADLVIYNPKRSLNSIPMHNPVSTIVYSGSSECVGTVFVGGELLLHERKLVNVDEEEVVKNCQHKANALMIKAHMKKRTTWKNLAF